MPCSEDADAGFSSSYFFSFLSPFLFSFVKNILRSQRLRLVQHACWNESRDNDDDGGLERLGYEQKADVIRQGYFTCLTPDCPPIWPFVLSRCFGDWTLMMLCVARYSHALVPWIVWTICPLVDISE